MNESGILIIVHSESWCTAAICDFDGNVIALVPSAKTSQEIERNADLLCIPYDCIEYVFK